jgi:hypothetical protein
MATQRDAIPASDALLCEQCGYTLNTLPADSRCPECGTPVADSIGTHRTPTRWDTPGGLFAFLQTSLLVIFRTKHFFTHLAVHPFQDRARKFALIHRLLTALFLGLAGAFHAGWLLGERRWAEYDLYLLVGFPVFAYLLLWLLTPVIRWLTNWEASYRGLRLPLPVVRRVLDYHSVHIIPVALVGLLTVIVYFYVIRQTQASVDLTQFYLYTLCGEVVLFSLYLFWTYWVAMRSVMYANR